MGRTLEIWPPAKALWAQPVVEKLKELDAVDATEGAETCDGMYMGIDVARIGDLYQKTYSEHQPGFLRLLEATKGLHIYRSEVSEEGRKHLEYLEFAMMEGISALVESRTADFRKISGFDRHFIREEFRFYFINEIYNEKPDANDRNWSEFWPALLEGCRIDMFINPFPCYFPKRHRK